MDSQLVRKVVHELFPKGDETILEYICGVLEDEHFEFGEDGEEAFESIGPFLVRIVGILDTYLLHLNSNSCITSAKNMTSLLMNFSLLQIDGGCCEGEGEARVGCRTLAAKLGGEQ
jgi:hypothetical protein